MPRNITVTLADGTKHVYANAPDDITPDAVMSRAQKDFAGVRVAAIDGGRTPVPPAVQSYVDRWKNMDPAHAAGLVQRFSGHRDNGGLITANDPRILALQHIAGNASPPVQPARHLIASRPAPTRDQRLTAMGRSLGASSPGAGDFGTAFGAGVRRSMFGIPERLAAAGERWLPSSITGNTSDASYDDILRVIRAKTDAEMGRSTGGNILGAITGGVGGGRAVGGIIGGIASKAASASSPWIARAGNFLENMVQMRKGQRLANAARVVGAGAAGGAAQAAGEGSDVGTGALYGAAGASVLGVGFKAAQVVSRPFRDFVRLSSAGQLLSRLTTATRDQLEARAAAYRTATGAEPTLFELLPLADRNKILKQAIVGRDSVVERASGAIRQRANNLGPEMSARARDVLEPQRRFIERGLQNDITAARGGTPHPDDAALVARAMDSPTDMSEFRDTEARAIMAPHDDTPVVANLTDLFPSVPGPGGTHIAVDPEVATVIRSAAGTLRQRGQNAGVTAGDITDMISTLRGDLGKGGIEGRNAERAINHLQDTLETRAPAAGAAARQMSEAYAARSRLMEGMQEGAGTRLRDDVQVGTSRRQARTVRNAYDTPEGATGRSLGQGNKALTNLEGSPEDALRATVGMSRNGIGRQLGQNVGQRPADEIVAAARAQDESAQALSAASNKAQGGSGDTGNAETLVQAVVGLHPSSFVTTKAGAVRKLLDMTYIPENRARMIVDMIFSQDPAMVRRAINAVGNAPNGAIFLQYLAGATGAASAQSGQAGGTLPEDTPPPDVPAAAEPAAIEAPAAVEPDAEALPAPADGQDAAQPVDPTSSPYAPALQQINETENPDLLALIERQFHQESGNRHFGSDGQPITSPKGAVGIAQVMPATAPEAARLAGLPWDENAYRYDPVYNKLLGIAYMSEQLRKYKGNVAQALAAYNAGPDRVDTALGMGDAWFGHLPPETQDYVQKVL